MWETVVSGLVGIGVGAFLTYHFKLRQERKKYKIQKYEEFVDVVEDLLSRDGQISIHEHMKQLNKAHARLVFSASPRVLDQIRTHLAGPFDANKREPIYRALRDDVYQWERWRRMCYMHRFEKERLSFFIERG